MSSEEAQNNIGGLPWVAPPALSRLSWPPLPQAPPPLPSHQQQQPSTHPVIPSGILPSGALPPSPSQPVAGVQSATSSRTAPSTAVASANNGRSHNEKDEEDKDKVEIIDEDPSNGAVLLSDDEMAVLDDSDFDYEVPEDDDDDEWQPGPAKSNKKPKNISTKRKQADGDEEQEQPVKKKRARKEKVVKPKPVKIKDLNGKEPWRDIPDWRGKQHLGCLLFNLPGELIDLVLGSRILNLRDHTALAATCRTLRACYFSRIVHAQPDSGHASAVQRSSLWQALIMHRPTPNNKSDRSPHYIVNETSVRKIWTVATVRPDEMQVLWRKPDTVVEPEPEIEVVEVAEDKDDEAEVVQESEAPAKAMPGRKAKSNRQSLEAGQEQLEDVDFVLVDDSSEDEDFAETKAAKKKMQAAKKKKLKKQAAKAKKQQQLKEKTAAQRAKVIAKADKEWAEKVGKPVRSHEWDEAIDLVADTKITKSKAISVYKVNERMLARIMCLFVRNPHYRSASEMQLYNAAAVEAMAIRCHGGAEAHEDLLKRREAAAAKSRATRRANAIARPPRQREYNYGWGFGHFHRRRWY
ncbi:hypothetical protein ACM66B_001015 [Microbotryomycetes sp. NB124-2]